MPMWPFGRRSRRDTQLKVEGPQPVSEGKKPVAPYSGAAAAVVDATHGVGRRPSRRQGNRKRKASVRDGPSQSGRVYSSSESSPTSEKQRYPRRSSEEITALPATKELGTSPHLRPAARDHADIPYNFHLQSTSLTSIPTARERGKLQRPPNLRKRGSANDSPQPRRKTNKKRKNDHVREEEIRAMSAPIPIPKRPAQSGLLRKDSKRIRGGLNRYLERPSSAISLPLEESIHSSMSGGSESREFRVSALDVFSPRPTIRYSLSSNPGDESNPSRSNSRKQKRTISKETLKEKRTVDDLADDMDASDLRELMERDRRRKEKRKKQEEERVRRRLERKAEKQRTKELKQTGETERGDKMDLDVRTPEPIGLGIAESSHITQPTVPLLDTTVGSQAQRVFRQTDGPTLARSTTSPTDPPTPIETPVEEPIVATAQAVRYSQASMSPPTSPTYHVRGPSNVSQMPSLAPELVAEEPELPAPQPPAVPLGRSSESGGRRIGGWTSFFRRGSKKAPTDRGRSPSEVSFSNTSRESMSRQPPPTHLQQLPETQRPVRARSGTPVRTQSKFREDLPELPLSPPDSRLQSPDPSGSAPKPIPARRGFKPPAHLYVAGRLSAGRASPEDDLPGNQTDSPVSPTGRVSALISNSEVLMSTSLASVDSEGSWLSGKPMKKKYIRSSVGSSSMMKQHEDFNASYEELGIPDDEYFKRLTPQPDMHRQSSLSASGVTRKPSSTAMALDLESDTDSELRSSPRDPSFPTKPIVHSTVGRQPTVIHREVRVKSREGLLNDFNECPVEIGDDSQQSSPARESSERDSPIEEMQSSMVARATSIDLGKKHARHLSAGSAKLLNIPARRQSVEQRRVSSAL